MLDLDEPSANLPNPFDYIVFQIFNRHNIYYFEIVRLKRFSGYIYFDFPVSSFMAPV